MPQPKWFIKDDDRGIDQEKWLVDYIEATVIANKHRMKDWKGETICKFEEQFPRDIRKKLYTGKGKRKRFERMETAEEAEERTSNRDKQLGYWLGTYVKRIIARVEQRERPVPEYLQIQEFKTSVVPRAHSARDLFITDNPHVMQDAVEAARASGTTDRSELQKLANEAVTIEMGRLTPEQLAIYVARSNEEKGLRRAERDALKPDVTAAASQIMSGDQRLKQLVDLEFTVQQAIRLWAEETQTEIVVMYGGADGTGGVRKWLMSNRDPANPDNFVNIIRDRNSAAHGILKTFDDFLIEHRGLPTLDHSSSTALPSSADQAAAIVSPPSADALVAMDSSSTNATALSPVIIEIPLVASAFASTPANPTASSPADTISPCTNAMVTPCGNSSLSSSTATTMSSPPNAVAPSSPCDGPISPLANAATSPPPHTVDVSSLTVVTSSSTTCTTGTAAGLSQPILNETTGTVGARGKKTKTMVELGRANDNAPQSNDEQVTSRPRRAKALAGVRAAVASVAPKRKACDDLSALTPKLKRARNARKA